MGSDTLENEKSTESASKALGAQAIHNYICILTGSGGKVQDFARLGGNMISDRSSVDKGIDISPNALHW